MFKLFENGIRGGVSGIFVNRYVESSQDTKIPYVDQNNLYGRVVKHHLPHNNFKMHENAKTSLNQTLNTRDNSDIGYAVPVDLKNPTNNNEMSKIFPFCPEKIF